MPENPMSELYRRLALVGLPEEFVRRVALPDYWDDEIALNPAGYAMALMDIARYTGISYGWLRGESNSGAHILNPKVIEGRCRSDPAWVIMRVGLSCMEKDRARDMVALMMEFVEFMEGGGKASEWDEKTARRETA